MLMELSSYVNVYIDSVCLKLLYMQLYHIGSLEINVILDLFSAMLYVVEYNAPKCPEGR